MSFGFRFLLVYPDGEPADPGMFLTSVPNWKGGDELLAGRDLEKFRIIGIDEEERVPDDARGVFTVEVVKT